MDGAIQGELFEAYVRLQPVPTPRTGDVVAMDDLAAHERAGARVATEGPGRRSPCLPPYGPDPNPIDPASSKLKALPREAGERTVEGLWELPGRVLDEFPPDGRRRLLSHRGYRVTPS